MVMASFLNPLSNEGQGIIKELGSLNNISIENDELLDIVTHTSRQTISRPDVVPQTIVDLALNRLKWYIERKNNKNYNSNDYAYLFNTDIVEYDTIAFHILAQAIATHFRPNSREVRLFVESQGLLIEDRLTKLLTSEKRELVDDVLSGLLVEDGLEWSFLKDVIASKKLSLTDLVLDEGEIILDRDEFIYAYGDKFENRAPERMYDILIGENLREMILTKLIMQNSENYISHIHEMLRTIEPHPIIVELGEQVEKTINHFLCPLVSCNIWCGYHSKGIRYRCRLEYYIE